MNYLPAAGAKIKGAQGGAKKNKKSFRGRNGGDTLPQGMNRGDSGGQGGKGGSQSS